MLFLRTLGIRYYKSYSYKTPARMSDRDFAFDQDNGIFFYRHIFRSRLLWYNRKDNAESKEFIEKTPASPAALWL